MDRRDLERRHRLRESQPGLQKPAGNIANVNCPLCSHPHHRVLRTAETHVGIRRTRRCERCGSTWATQEIAEETVEKAAEILKRAREIAQLAD